MKKLPKKKNPFSRSVRIIFRVDEDEAATLKGFAKVSGLSLSDYIRTMLLPVKEEEKS